MSDAAPAVDAESAGEARGATIRRFVQGDLASLRVVIGLALIWAIFQFENDRFLSAQNLTNLMLQITAIGLISVGIVYVLLLGEIDLSVGAVSGLAAAVMAVLNVKHGWSPYLAIAAAVAVGHGDRRAAGVALHPLRDPLVRRHPGRAARLAGSALTGARLDRVDQPHRPEDHRARQHLLLRRGRLDDGGCRDRRLRRSARARPPAAGRGRPGRRERDLAGGALRSRLRRRARRRRDPQLRPRSAARRADPARLRDRHGVRRQADRLRPPRVRRRRQRRGGPPGGHPGRRGADRGLRDRRDDGRDRRGDGRLATAGRQPELGRQRTPAARDRGPGDRRHQPLRRPRLGLDGAARCARDRLDLQRHGPAGALLGRQVHGHRRRAAARRDRRRDRPPAAPDHAAASSARRAARRRSRRRGRRARRPGPPAVVRRRRGACPSPGSAAP